MPRPRVLPTSLLNTIHHHSSPSPSPSPSTKQTQTKTPALNTQPNPTDTTSTLALTMSSYTPRVTCLARLTPWPHTASYFRALARAFPAHSTPRVFGSGPGATETLPWETKGGYLIPGERALGILLQIPPFSEAYQETSSWWEVYAAVSAVWAMCGREGKAGYAEGIGRFVHFLAPHSLFFGAGRFMSLHPERRHGWRHRLRNKTRHSLTPLGLQ